MIAFDLICSNGHLFECWFKDSASFEEQKSSGIINCPICDDTQVERVYSPFMIKKGEGGKREGEKREGEKRGGEKREEVNPYQALRLVQEYLDKNFEDVGMSFAKEALKMHWGESEKRNIKGTATPQEETLLKEEGVQFFRVPIIKRLYN